MNRRQILNRAACLIPGGSMLQNHARTSISTHDTNLSVPKMNEWKAIHTSQDNADVMVDLLHICLKRIDWQGNVSEWQNRLLQVIERIQSLVEGQGPASESLLMTAHQMDITADLCRAAQTGIKEKILESALRFAEALVPLDHFVEMGPPLKGAEFDSVKLSLHATWPSGHGLVRRVRRHANPPQCGLFIPPKANRLEKNCAASI